MFAMAEVTDAPIISSKAQGHQTSKAPENNTNLVFEFWLVHHAPAGSCVLASRPPVVVVVVVNGSYSAAPYSSPDRECITKSQLMKIKHRRST